MLVAHAFGSCNMRVFADRYMRDVGGIVLVDADDGDVEPAKWQARDQRDFQKIIAALRQYIQLDDPPVVLNAIREVLDAVPKG